MLWIQISQVLTKVVLHLIYWFIYALYISYFLLPLLYLFSCLSSLLLPHLLSPPFFFPPLFFAQDFSALSNVDTRRPKIYVIYFLQLVILIYLIYLNFVVFFSPSLSSLFTSPLHLSRVNESCLILYSFSLFPRLLSFLYSLITLF